MKIATSFTPTSPERRAYEDAKMREEVRAAGEWAAKQASREKKDASK